MAIQKTISLWIDKLPDNWKETFDMGENDLGILLAILIAKNWDGHIDVNISSDSGINTQNISAFNDMVRFPKSTIINLLNGSIIQNIEMHRNADLNVFSISGEMKINEMIDIVQRSRISSIFCIDSGYENALV